MGFSSHSTYIVLAVVLAVEVSTESLGQTCSKSSKWSGRCISINDCPKLLAYAQEPELYISFLREASCGFSGKTPLVCCASHVGTQTAISSKPVASTPVQDTSSHPNARLLPMDTCGPTADSRIIGGSEANILEYPWMALLGYLYRGKMLFGCGGSLINDKYVLTAAHCVSNLRSGYKLTSVRLGEHDLDKIVDCDNITGYCSPPPLNFGIDQTVPHQQHSTRMRKNDIALIRLRGSVDFTQTPLRAVCLPAGQLHQNRNLDKEHMIVAGWGQTEEGVSSQVLLKVAVPVVPLSQCKVVYTSTAEIGPSQLCAGAQKGYDSCKGDSGSPLILTGFVGGEQRIVQYGVVSFGPAPCGKEGEPGVYTRVGYYMDWILDNIRP